METLTASGARTAPPGEADREADKEADKEADREADAEVDMSSRRQFVRGEKGA